MSPHQPLGLAPLTVLDCAPLEMARLARQIGYSAIGLRLFPAYPGSPVYPVPVGSALMAELQRTLHGEGVRVFDIEFVLVGPEFDIEPLKAGLESAEALGAERLNIAGDDDDFGRLCTNMSALADLAAVHGMAVDIEPMLWRKVNSFPRAIAVLDAINKPNTGLLTDTLHLSRTGFSVAELARVNPRYLKALQICDAVQEKPATMELLLAEARGGRLPPGEGALPLADVIAAMPQDCIYSVEIPLPQSLSREERARRCFTPTLTLLQTSKPGSLRKANA